MGDKTSEQLYKEAKKYICLYKRNDELLLNEVAEDRTYPNVKYSFMEWDNDSGAGHILFDENIIFIGSVDEVSFDWVYKNYAEYFI